MIWACHQCQSDMKQTKCCGRKPCEFSLFRTKKIEEMIQHMIDVHGSKPPCSWERYLSLDLIEPPDLVPDLKELLRAQKKATKNQIKNLRAEKKKKRKQKKKTKK